MHKKPRDSATPKGVIMKKIFFALTVFFLLFSSVCLVGDMWEPTGSLNPGHSEFPSITLDDGRVLIAGGFIGCYETSSCAIYDPITGEWVATDSMSYAASNFTLTKLPDGKILAIYSAFSEVFNPITEMWEGLTTLNFSRHYHAAILLQNGKVLVVGGDNTNNYKGCELYDYTTNEWTLTGFCFYPKLWHTLELLTDGRVMAIGGGNANYQYCEIYDYNTGIWSEIAPLNDPRYGHTSHSQSNGDVMVIAGTNGNIFLKSCEIHNFQMNQWTYADSLENSRVGHCSESLLNRKTLVMSGQGEIGSGSAYSCEIYNPLTNEWETAASLTGSKTNGSSETLEDERVLAIGQYICETYTWNYTPQVSQPQTLSGLNEAIVGEVLTFSVITSEPDNDSLSVHIDWGNGEFSEWTELVVSGTTLEFSYSWTEPGIYQVRAQTADQWFFLNEECHNSLSNWTNPVILTIFGIPQIEVSTEPLDFGTVYIGEDSLLTLTVSNLGNGTLTANAYTNTDEYSVSHCPFSIEPGETLNVEITFTPSYEGVIIDTLTILSNDPENPEIQIELVGEGELGIPQISVSTDSLNFGSVFIGSDSLLALSVSNIGYGILAANAHTNTDEYSVSPSSFNLEPGSIQRINVTFAPTYEGIITDTLTILSNDPENPEVEIFLIGEGQIQVSTENYELQITNYELGNHPNPFNPATIIYFNAENAENAEIVIYNIKGQKIRILGNLESESLSPYYADGVGYSKKSYSISWNGKDDKNHPVGSGIYFYRLLVDGKFKASKKMLLLK